jgi:ABC-type lipoprotein export system ATPase subunit
MPKLTDVRVTGLLGEFDHHISFENNWEFVIIFGPNGVGKTKLLELIDAILKTQPRRVARIPFKSARLAFDDHSVLNVTISAESFATATESRDVVFNLQQLAAPGSHWVSRLVIDQSGSSLQRWLERSTTWRPAGNDLWEDQSDGEIIDVIELEARFANQIPGNLTSQVDEPPEDLKSFVESCPSHFIDTQRLLTVPTARRVSGFSSGRARNRATVSAYADDLKRRLANALAVNSRTTQQLDRTFPARLLNTPEDRTITDDTIRRQYSEQNDLRRRLAEISLIGGEPDVPLPQRQLEAWERKVLSTYLEDTDLKLATFESLLAKVTLFQQILNRRFLRKDVRVTVDDGLTIRRDGSGDAIALNSLSSGEQHELILIYDLLFNVEQGTTVLVDEPEISLHVAWQKSFLDDITSIAVLASLRFIVATHSPQIINKWWERATQLGPTEGMLQ